MSFKSLGRESKLSLTSLGFESKTFSLVSFLAAGIALYKSESQPVSFNMASIISSIIETPLNA